MDKISKLSQAIRLGATFRPQCKKAFFGKVNGQIGSCAFGAAHEALTGEAKVPRGRMASKIMERFGVSNEIGEAIVNRNDAGETREQIADWLEEQGL